MSAFFEGIISGYRKVELSTICVSTILLTGHLMRGTVYLTVSSCLIQLTLLNPKLINFGNTNLLYMILKPIFREPEVEVEVGIG